VTATGPGFGTAQMWVDGRLIRTVDLSAAASSFGAQRTISGLSDRNHTIKVVVVGAPGANGSGDAVAIDAWTVR
jgi:hypothetical protein